MSSYAQSIFIYVCNPLATSVYSALNDSFLGIKIIPNKFYHSISDFYAP